MKHKTGNIYKVILGGKEYKELASLVLPDGTIVLDIFGRKQFKIGDYTLVGNILTGVK